MTDLQRYDIDSEIPQKNREIRCLEIEIPRLLLRIADLEAAEPVSAVMQSQVDDVIGGVGDCEIPPHMDPRRHPVCQCLIAAILDNARLRERETILTTTIANLHDEIDKARDFVRLVREEWDIHTPPRITEALKKMDAPDA